MTPEEEAYAEALRRIRKAQETGADALDLSKLPALNRLPQELVDLTKLQSLDLSWSWQLSDFSPLTALTSLQSLGLTLCRQLSDLSPLASLTSLQSLDLSECWQLSGNLAPLEHLTSLQVLDLSWCWQLSGDLSPLAGLTSLQFLYLIGCDQLSGDLSPLASLTSLQSLYLSGCNQLSDLSPLASLTSLQSLDLSGCDQLSDLSPLASLTSLQSLKLTGCGQISDLGPLAGLTSLQWLHLSHCLGFRRFAPLESLLPTLKDLRLFGCKLDDLPSEICGKSLYENVLDKVRAHYEDLKSGQRIDAEVKVLFLGKWRSRQDATVPPAARFAIRSERPYHTWGPTWAYDCDIGELPGTGAAEFVGLRRTRYLPRIAHAFSSRAGCLSPAPGRLSLNGAQATRKSVSC
jgi:Leucine Rich repeats (2 copies)